MPPFLRFFLLYNNYTYCQQIDLPLNGKAQAYGGTVKLRKLKVMSKGSIARYVPIYPFLKIPISKTE